MPNRLQTFVATSTQKAYENLEAAVLRIPEDKRSWSPMGKARSAMDQAAECAILNGSTAVLMKTHVWAADFDFAEYEKSKADLAQDGAKVLAMLKENTAKAIAAIETVPDGDLDIEIAMPWGPMTLAQIVAYPYWNMSYHEGQINYIASMLGCLP